VNRRPALLLLVPALLAALGACGIPSNTAVVPLGPAPPYGTSAAADTAPRRAQRTDTVDRSLFVSNYLAAAAGDLKDALDRVRQFMTPEAAAAFRAPAPGLRVVRLTEDPLVNPGRDEVTFKAQQVGVLDDHGILDPTSTGPVPYEMQISEMPGGTGLYVRKAPPVLLLGDKALDNFYERRTIYFWNRDHSALVPDVRYLPKTVPPEGQPNEILNWLVSGPAPWLHDAVEPLPEGTVLNGNVPAASNDRLQVSLSAQAVAPDDPGALDRLRRQLLWSLRGNLPGSLELKVGNNPPADYQQTDYLESNPAYRLNRTPERFAVYNGQIRRLAHSAGAGDPVPVLMPEANRNVATAALATSGMRDYAALVVSEPGGAEALRVGSAPAGEQAPLKRIALPAPIGRPSWAVDPGLGQPDGTVGVVPAKGRLYVFGPAGGARRLDWPGGSGAITSVAVAPDARRVALVVGGTLYLTAMTATDDGTQLSAPRAISTGMRGLSAVDWASETKLVVAGVKQNGRVAVMEVSTDGAAQSDLLPDLGTDRVTYLAAYPASPVSGKEEATAVMYVADKAAYDAFDPAKIGVADLAPPVASPPAGVVPTAPLFLD
jgi:Lipoprotein LpqB beta-propeller domain